MFSIISIFVTTLLLSYLVYRGNTILLFSAFCTVVLVLLGEGSAADLVKHIQILLYALSKYFVLYFPIFLLGAVFGNLLKKSGYGKVIAYWLVEKVGRDQAVLSTVLLCATLTYSGVSLFVITFVVYPVIKPLFQCANLPKRLIPAAIAFGSFTFTMTAFPGSSSVVNVMPTGFFHTDAYAASVLGIVCGSAMFVIGMAWFNYRIKQADLLQEGYLEGFVFEEQELIDRNDPFIVAILPLIIIIAAGLLLPACFEITPDCDYLNKRQYSLSDINTFADNIYIAIGLLAGIGTIIISNYRNLDDIKRVINKGAEFSLVPIVSTASVMGYGAVVAAVPAFSALKSVIASWSLDSPILSASLASIVFSSCSGSASMGMSMILANIGDFLYKAAVSLGTDPEILHRITSMSVGIFDSLPSNGAIISIMAVTSLTFRESYKDMFVTTVLVPLAVVISAITFCLVI
ncbi:MAG: hypothetical protein LBI30_04180 [Holosporales bacterium]|jgi:H+/gluconate symporter-like permease|nr:hypothetical protein [Holosporales bacterium]